MEIYLDYKDHLVDGNEEMELSDKHETIKEVSYYCQLIKITIIFLLVF